MYRVTNKKPLIPNSKVDFTPPQIAGVSVGCAVAAFLAGFGYAPFLITVSMLLISTSAEF